MKNDQDFLLQLKEQAHKQSLLNSKRLLPKQLDVVTSLIGQYPWQILLLTSGLTAMILEVL